MLKDLEKFLGHPLFDADIFCPDISDQELVEIVFYRNCYRTNDSGEIDTLNLWLERFSGLVVN